MKLFGDQSAKTLAHAPAGEITQLVGYARRADSPQTAKLLHEAYRKSGGQVLKHLSWKHIMAGGLSAGAIITAYKLSGGVAELAEKHPESFERIIDKWTWPIPVFLAGLLLILLWQTWRIISRTGKWVSSKIPQPKQEKDKRNDKNGPEPVPEHNNSTEEQTI